MPELPETETIARDLDAALPGAVVRAVSVPRPSVLREADAAGLAARAAGARIDRVWRRAKLIVLDLSTGDRLVVQPRFTGALLLEPAPGDGSGLPERERGFVRVTLALADGRALHYRDIRALGTVALMDAARFAAYAGALGPEPLDPAFDAPALHAALGASRQPVKKVLMDQRRLVGVGNIYANEALWRARVAPARPAASLTRAESRRVRDAIVAVLSESIALRGTSFRDYVDASGGRGGFVERLAVYGRAGAPCGRCGDALEGTHAVDGRQTVFCPRCQR
ncbi:bifunctional DNA-formamidopyrimidine glycosylase/DNA-(apurinic or apyrimidinic site) lyase [Roseisolibacter sp. H3M3-2]|uniref:bifunctional DNA-formamidopyrimidine glycosylase/DNA-(apurinic or apyrimidinic site) lyase n=1 Tax=Roseisolibacter sp. H3M3-2 TaxID=3031323 RepID=UPI0023DC65EB|nr:bifunctional DNA-formamidopyrimidine glycosylase/DNA-(apurinic or apyrimidinic site) lyase [Roseisolibacter sp. H3M3-2]MDF1501592.1 bifunctional DNA-formamidopyrimidine glycosylase/DNA-(apurinic or apyrimidinic site) lyase [Roseisolibacter sp. H3M3-2]